jgi:hypothetical protein
MLAWLKQIFGVKNVPSAVVGRNEPCPCGSGAKFKRCCLSDVQAKTREARAIAQVTSENGDVHVGPSRVADRPLTRANDRTAK